MLIKMQYFDDRFYCLNILKNELDAISLKEVNPNFINTTDEGVEIYCPSVTTILNLVSPMPYLARWRGDIGNREADYIVSEALDNGSHIHSGCEAYCKNKTLYMLEVEDLVKNIEDKFLVRSQMAMMQIARFEKLLDLFKPKIISIEESVFKLGKICYAGTLDYIFEIKEGIYELSNRTKIELKGGLYVVDLKTGKSASDTMFIQTSAYTKCIMDKEIIGNMIWHLNSDRKTGIIGANVLATYDIELYYEQFLNYYKTFMFQNSELKPKLYKIPLILKKGKNYE
jgi:hypothetical protein